MGKHGQPIDYKEFDGNPVSPFGAYKKLYPILKMQVFKALGNFYSANRQELIEDLTSESFLRCHRYFHTFDPTKGSNPMSSLVTWCARVAWVHVKDYILKYDRIPIDKPQYTLEENLSVMGDEDGEVSHTHFDYIESEDEMELKREKGFEFVIQSNPDIKYFDIVDEVNKAALVDYLGPRLQKRVATNDELWPLVTKFVKNAKNALKTKLTDEQVSTLPLDKANIKHQENAKMIMERYNVEVSSFGATSQKIDTHLYYKINTDQFWVRHAQRGISANFDNLDEAVSYIKHHPKLKRKKRGGI